MRGDTWEDNEVKIMTTTVMNQEPSVLGPIVTIFNPFMEIALRQANEMVLYGNFEEAIELLNRAIRINPLDPRPYQIKGEIYETIGKYGEAIFNYNLSLKKDPGNEDIVFDKTIVAEKIGDLYDNWEYFCLNTPITISP